MNENPFKNIGDSYVTDDGHKGFYDIKGQQEWFDTTYRHVLVHKKNYFVLRSNATFVGLDDEDFVRIKNSTRSTRLVLTEKTFFYVPKS